MDNMNYKTYLERIEDNINTLVETQNNVNELYDDMDKDNLNIEEICQGLQEEKDILDSLMDNLNKMFNIRPSWHRKGFRIIPYHFSRYKIKPPHIDKSSIEYVLLKKLMIELHKKHFLHDGMIGYLESTVESHMWEIPNTIPDDKFIRKLRRQLK